MAGLLEPGSFMERIPYQGLVTFWRAPYTRELDGVDLAVYGVPLDSDLVNRPGARFGPRAVREQSCYVGVVEECWPHGYQLKDRYSLIDYGDVAFFPGQIDQMLTSTETAVTNILSAGALSLGIGGDHLTTYPALKAHAKKFGKLSLIHFDAHTDTFECPHLNHGSMFWHAVQEGLIDPTHSIQIGIRTQIPEGMPFNILTADKCLEMGSKGILAEIKKVVGERNCYVTLDVDGMDPAHAPGTGTPLPGGITSAMQREILWGIKGMNVTGGDVVEVSPPYDPSAITAILGATVAMDILHALAESPVRARHASTKAVSARK